eukprot:COSAG01_NODE_6078_length_3864_cov_12.433510_2_plen_317_part_00
MGRQQARESDFDREPAGSEHSNPLRTRRLRASRRSSRQRMHDVADFSLSGWKARVGWDHATRHSKRHVHEDADDEELHIDFSPEDWLNDIHHGGNGDGKEPRFSVVNITPVAPDWVSTFLYYRNGLLNNSLNKLVYVNFKARLQLLAIRVRTMHEHVADVVTSKEIFDAADKTGRSDIDYATLRAEEDIGAFEAWTEKDSAPVDAALRENFPGFQERFLEELCMTYQELDSILIKTSEDRRRKVHKIWDPKAPRQHPGQHGTWEATNRRGAWVRKKPMIGCWRGKGLELNTNDINDLFCECNRLADFVMLSLSPCI